MPAGNELVVTASVTGRMVMLRCAVAVCAAGIVESVTVMVAEAVPTELCAGVPVIAPVALLIASPPGRPLAL
jgi:hypothetical protein